MDRKALGRRVREARELAGLSQQAAAETLGLPRTAVTQIEAGNRSVSTLELSQLAGLLRRPVGWFLRDTEDADEDLLVILHRVAAGLGEASEVRDAVDRCVHICREAAALRTLLGHEQQEGPPSYPEPAPRTTGEAVRQGERVAEQERRRLGLGSAPIVDLTGLISDQGIWTATSPLPDPMSGLFLQHASLGIAILVNASHAYSRQRFSLAHEYAHALFDRDRVVGVSSAENRSERIEQRANAFAAAFLMPQAGIEEELRRLGKGQPARTDQYVFDVATEGAIRGQLRSAPRSQAIGFHDVARIAYAFGVSYQAAAYRLQSLRYLSPGAAVLSAEQEASGRALLRALELFDELEAPMEARRGSRELRNQVALLAFDAFQAGEISRGRLLDLGRLIGIDGRKLLQLAETVEAE